MKKILYALSALLTVSSAASAQVVTQEHSYANVYYGQIIRLQDEGDKYFVYDTITKKHSFYNPDHSLWKTLNYTLPPNAKYPGITCPSTKFFNTDAKLEFALTYYTQQTPSSAFTVTCLIMNEDGTVLQTLPNIAGLSAQKVDGTWKAIGQEYPAYNWTIFSVPGSMPDPMAVQPMTDKPVSSTLYPNPVTDAATIEYQLPAGMSQGTIEIMNTSGQSVKTYTVTNQFSNIVIRRGDLPSGTYIYKVAGGQAKPFVVQ